jgi:hypothetical protein
MRSQRSAGVRPPAAASDANVASQVADSGLPAPRQIACASLIHAASAGASARRALSWAQRSSVDLMPGRHAAISAAQSSRRDAAASHSSRNASPTAWRSWRARKASARARGSVSISRRSAAYSIQP